MAVVSISTTQEVISTKDLVDKQTPCGSEAFLSWLTDGETSFLGSEVSPWIDRLNLFISDFSCTWQAICAIGNFKDIKSVGLNVYNVVSKKVSTKHFLIVGWSLSLRAVTFRWLKSGPTRLLASPPLFTMLSDLLTVTPVQVPAALRQIEIWQSK